MSKQDVIDYVMNTPYNTNEAVLRTLLDDLGDSNSNNVCVLIYEQIPSETSDTDIIVCNKTYDEIDQAMNNNAIFYAINKEGIGETSPSFIIVLKVVNQDSVPQYFLVRQYDSFIDNREMQLQIEEFKHYPDDTIEWSDEYSYTINPDE